MKDGDWVRTTQPEMGIAQGPAGTAGDGQPREIPAGAVCEVFSVEPGLRWATIHHELDYGGHLDPFRIEAIVELDRLVPASRPASVDFQMSPPPPDVMDGATLESWRDLLPEILEEGLTQAYYDVMPPEIRALLEPSATAHLSNPTLKGETSEVPGNQLSLRDIDEGRSEATGE